MKFYQSLKEEIVNEIYLFHLQSQVMPCISVYQPVPSSFLSRWKVLLLFTDEKPMAGLRRNSEHPSYPVLHSSPVNLHLLDCFTRIFSYAKQKAK